MTIAGVYIHVPFCRHKCRYCDFYSITGAALIDAYLTGLDSEIGRSTAAGAAVDTVYIGGGTPSLLGPAAIGRILDRVSAVFSVGPGAEITLEVNPGTVAPGHPAEYAAAGVNRLSVGVQSFDDAALAFLGRIHTAAEAADTLTRARAAGFDNLGVDLIYGLPGQTTAGWEADMSAALAFSPEHLSCYALTVEAGTPLAFDMAAGRFSPLPDDRVNALFRATRRRLLGAGYIHYEISNFARLSARVSRHNRKYWTGAAYFGFGPAAHSFSPPERWWNIADVAAYAEAAAAGRSIVAGRERVSREQSMIEALMLGLRQTAGIDVARFNRDFDADFHTMFAGVLGPLKSRGLIDADAARCRLTEAGMLVMDAVAGRLAGEIR